MNSIDQNYYLNRASEHRTSAASANLAKVAQIHLELAQNYERLADIQDVGEATQEPVARSA